MGKERKKLKGREKRKIKAPESGNQGGANIDYKD